MASYLEHPPDSADWVEAKVGIVLIEHHMSLIADPHLCERGVVSVLYAK